MSNKLQKVEIELVEKNMDIASITETKKMEHENEKLLE